MSEPAEETNLTESNIENINKDTEKVKNINKKSNSESSFKEDVDDLSKYTDVQEDGVSILKDTTSINRKAIFHDLNRLKHWREAVDQESIDNTTNTDSSSHETTQTFEPIMEKNIDSILDKLPDVIETGRVDKGSVDSKAAEKLNQLEHKLESKYTLDRKN